MVEKSGWSEKGPKRSRPDSDDAIEELDNEITEQTEGQTGDDAEAQSATSERSESELDGSEQPSQRRSTEPSAETVVPSRPSKRAGGKTAAEASRVTRTRSSAGSSKVARAAATAGQRDRSIGSKLGFPALVTFVCVLGLLASAWAWQARDATAAPRQNHDYWLAVYGVYDCTREGEDKWVPKFLSRQNNTGISSRGDGLIHISPYLEASSGENARLGHWFNEMNIAVNPMAMLLDNGAVLSAGTECADGSGPAEIKVLQWDYDFQALADHPPSNVYTEDFDQIRFMNDREVFVIAFAAADTEIPNPPAERFELLNQATDEADYTPADLIPSGD